MGSSVKAPSTVSAKTANRGCAQRVIARMTSHAILRVVNVLIGVPTLNVTWVNFVIPQQGSVPWAVASRALHAMTVLVMPYVLAMEMALPFVCRHVWITYVVKIIAAQSFSPRGPKDCSDVFRRVKMMLDHEMYALTSPVSDSVNARMVSALRVRTVRPIVTALQGVAAIERHSSVWMHVKQAGVSVDVCAVMRATVSKRPAVEAI